MKLTTEQIEYVENYIISKDIKWYELQVELTDHMVTSMEGFWEKNPELAFHQVKQYAENIFVGDSSFKSIEKERTLILQKEYKSSRLKMVKYYLSFPKIIGTVLAVLAIYKISFYFQDSIKFISRLFLFLFLFLIPISYQWIKNLKIEGKRFLAIENSPAYWALLSFPNLGLSLSNVFKDEILQNHLVLLPFICLWVLGSLFCITGIHLNDKIVATIKKQYQLT
jgi:hypothetical protein